MNEFKKQVFPYKDKLYRFALRIVGNVAEAEDVVQEVFIKMWHKRSEMDQYASIEAWCMRLTKNLSIDKLRSKHRRVVGIVNEGFDIKEIAPSPYQKTEMKDTFSHILQLMQALPEKQRLVMQLRDIEGMSYQEVAETLDIPMNQVKVNLFRARKQIKQTLLNKESYGL